MSYKEEPESREVLVKLKFAHHDADCCQCYHAYSTVNTNSDFVIKEPEKRGNYSCN